MELHLDDQQRLLFEKDFPPEEWQKMLLFRDYVTDHVKKSGWKIGAEVGVRRGQLLFKLLTECPELTMIAVDPWKPNKADRRDVHEVYRKEVYTKAKAFGSRVTIYQMYSKDAVTLISDRYLDFVFIDADHSYNSCKEDIQLWAPKVKLGGQLLGDDFQRAIGVEKAVKELLPQWKLLSPNIWYSPNTAKK